MTDENKDHKGDGQYLPESRTALSGEVLPGGVLEQELWRRRQERRDREAAQTLDAGDAALAPLILSLARLAAHRHVSRPSRDEGRDSE